MKKPCKMRFYPVKSVGKFQKGGLPVFTKKERYQMSDLMDIVALLRDPVSGCPWDKVQTHGSIRQNFLEETYEVADAIDLGDTHLLCEELGDILLQVALHTQMEAEQGTFTLEDVTTGICEKLILRHPHIFGTVKADDAETVLQNWEAIKREEKQRLTLSENLDSVPTALPALMRSRKVQKRAADHGFNYSGTEAAFADFDSEVVELKAAIAAKDTQNITEELGDVLFSAVNISRFVKIDAEEALTQSTAKFIRRVKEVERLAVQQGENLDTLDAAALDKLWKQAKVCTDL